ncbi:MAG: hypothetical protein HC888_16705, partial [Candidatus Competibacteraceae bacterium]|nr:hypothetical protein [Candidatus Competibacteraceae bacterium]
MKQAIETALRLAAKKGKTNISEIAEMIQTAIDLAGEMEPPKQFQQETGPAIIIPSQEEVLGLGMLHGGLLVDKFGQEDSPDPNAKILDPNIEANWDIEVDKVAKKPDYSVSDGAKVYWDINNLKAYVEQYTPREITCRLAGTETDVTFTRVIAVNNNPNVPAGMRYVSLRYESNQVQMCVGSGTTKDSNGKELPSSVHYNGKNLTNGKASSVPSHAPSERFHITDPAEKLMYWVCQRIEGCKCCC